jgi:uncharacterized membrane protein
MMQYIKLYVPTLVAFLAIDFVWLAFVARGFYRKHLGYLLAEQPNWWAAAAFYLLFIAGMVVFVVAPAVESGSIWRAVLLGAFFGLVTYATYDFTNHATVRGWPWIVTVVDLGWGAVLASSVCTIAYLAGRWLVR